jgi:hypothetical protein
MCLENGTFFGPNPLPSCVATPTCGAPFPPFLDSGLVLSSNSNVSLGTSAIYTWDRFYKTPFLPKTFGINFLEKISPRKQYVCKFI